MSLRVLGIDPGSYYMGVGIIERRGNIPLLIHAEVLQASKSLPFFERLKQIQEELQRVLNTFTPTVLAIEDTFYAKNVRAAFQLGVAKGIAISACLQKNIPIFEYAPTHVKSVVTGNGRADKEQVRRMVEVSFSKTIPLRHDATDALALALCHTFTQTWEKKDCLKNGGSA